MDASEITAGCQVRLINRPPYLKTADPMPMLRPPDILAIGEEGTIVDRRPGNYWRVRFARGVFLLESQYLEKVVHPELSKEEK